MSNVTDMGPYRRRKGGASRVHADEIADRFRQRTHAEVMARLDVLDGRPYTPENDDMRELLNARLGVFE
jgi:hypothetical protein